MRQQPHGTRDGGIWDGGAQAPSQGAVQLEPVAGHAGEAQRAGRARVPDLSFWSSPLCSKETQTLWRRSGKISWKSGLDMNLTGGGLEKRAAVCCEWPRGVRGEDGGRSASAKPPSGPHLYQGSGLPRPPPHTLHTQVHCLRPLLLRPGLSLSPPRTHLFL